MDFALPQSLARSLERYEQYLDSRRAAFHAWYKEKNIPPSFFREIAGQGGLGFEDASEGVREQPALKQGLFMEALARRSPGVAVAALVQSSLGLKALALFGSEALRREHMPPGTRGETLVCLGNTESGAGSDVAGIAMTARETREGWILNGSKSYVTSGALSRYGVLTALTDPNAPRTRRMSLFWVDLDADGVSRRKLNKAVWVPSDLTRLAFKEVCVPRENLMGERGKGMAQVLEIFTQSRLNISALTLAAGPGRLATESETSRVTFRELSAREIADYLGKIHYMDKAGAYAVQEWGHLIIERIEGSISNVIGLPLRLFFRMAREFDLDGSIYFTHPVVKS